MLAGAVLMLHGRKVREFYVSQHCWQKEKFMSFATECRRWTESLCLTKRDLCVRERGPTDLAPMLQYRLRLASKTRVISLSGKTLYTAFPHVWGRILQEGTPDRLTLLMDTYKCEVTVRDGQLPDTCRRGQLAHDFKTNPCSRVTHALYVIGVEVPSRKQIHIEVAYGYDDHGLPVFTDAGETTYMPDDIPGGRIPEMIAEYVAAVPQKRRRQ